YGWVDNFDPGWTPNTTDASSRRYCFARQPAIAHWNLERLADALSPLLPDPNELSIGLERYHAVYASEFCTAYAAKLGFRSWMNDDADLLESLFDLLYHGEIDMTEFFRRLADLAVDDPQLATVQSAFYRDDLAGQVAPGLTRWLARYAARLRQDGDSAAERIARMNRANPRYVLRNYLAQQAIDLAEQGDTTMIAELLAVLRHPYDEQEGAERFSAKRPDWARHRAGCSMLSCSS
ncbi:MAG TPA: protein adenylyltransferase SelO family protein, partial [Accumulibacter sp.]|nr:protein adenylyltransferase SelO family protein [Accumulibacter sp.]